MCAIWRKMQITCQLSFCYNIQRLLVCVAPSWQRQCSLPGKANCVTGTSSMPTKGHQLVETPPNSVEIFKVSTTVDFKRHALKSSMLDCRNWKAMDTTPIWHTHSALGHYGLWAWIFRMLKLTDLENVFHGSTVQKLYSLVKWQFLIVVAFFWEVGEWWVHADIPLISWERPVDYPTLHGLGYPIELLLYTLEWDVFSHYFCTDIKHRLRVVDPAA